MLVLGVLMLLAIMMIPLIVNLEMGFLQSQTDFRYEQASAESESVVRVLKKLMTEALAQNIYYEDADIRNLAAELQSRTFVNSDIQVTSFNGDPVRIDVVSLSGEGQLQRDKKTVLPILTFPKEATSGGGGEGPAAGSNGNEFYYQWAVAIDNAFYNQFYHACGNPDTPQDSFYQNQLPVDPELLAEYQAQFEDYVDYYVGDNFSDKLVQRKSMISTAPWADIRNNVLYTIDSLHDNTTTSHSASPGQISGISSNGHVQITNGWSLTRVNKLPASDAAIHIKGNLAIPNYMSNQVVMDGDVWVGGNWTTGGGELLTVNGNVYVKGDMIFNGSSKLVVNGNLYVGGKLEFTSSMARFEVSGDVISENIRFDGGANGEFKVKGDMVSMSQITVSNAITTLEVGEWSGNTIVSTDKGHIVAGGSLTFNGLNFLRAAKDVSSASYTNGEIKNVLIGGSFITNSGASFSANITIMRVTGEISVGGVLNIGSTSGDLTVGESVIAQGGIQFHNITELNIGGSMLSNGNIVYTSTMGNSHITGDVISGGYISFQNLGNSTSEGLNIGGSLIAVGNIDFQPSNQIKIGGDLMSLGDISFNNQVSGLFHINGIVGAYNNVTFAGGGIHNSSIPYPKNKFGGFYAGGTTTFPNSYEWWGGINAICIEYSAPNPGSGSGSGIGLEFGI